jgi:hypothetical protein
LVQRAAEEKHKEFFISEVITFNVLWKASISIYMLNGLSNKRSLDIKAIASDSHHIYHRF